MIRRQRCSSSAIARRKSGHSTRASAAPLYICIYGERDHPQKNSFAFFCFFVDSKMRGVNTLSPEQPSLKPVAALLDASHLDTLPFKTALEALQAVRVNMDEASEEVHGVSVLLSSCDSSRDLADFEGHEVVVASWDELLRPVIVSTYTVKAAPGVNTINLVNVTRGGRCWVAEIGQLPLPVKPEAALVQSALRPVALQRLADFRRGLAQRQERKADVFFDLNEVIGFPRLPDLVDALQEFDNQGSV
ncbi:MAG: uncharacterized protein KVP18_001596 [Porospora cf. gigantea A]|uniref:uncharacterized protein n=2 Tax=Porospora cf. gigantea A TaxID=2853593 RepID=UPI00355A8AD9|nr:MAG: hypothetical protein KVP18_001596 [Porospora cf. gigantea A]